MAFTGERCRDSNKDRQTQSLTRTHTQMGVVRGQSPGRRKREGDQAREG